MGTVATGARVNPVRECQALFFFLNLFSCAGTAVDKIRLFERFKGFFVKLVTIGLSNNRLVAHEIELTECLQNASGVSIPTSLLINIFNADEPGSVVRTSIEKTCHGARQTPEVEFSCGARGKATSVGCLSKW